MKVLHVASFTGNIGDNANHLGLRRVIEAVLGAGVVYENWEIRRCYQNYHAPDRWGFDERFVEAANQSDLVVIGGGNFFEPWIESSATGTTIDFSVKHLDAVTTPVAFYGVGFDTHKGYTKKTLASFASFAEAASLKNSVFFSFRNDGSMENFRKVYPDTSVKPYIVPDGAFFFRTPKSDWLPDDSVYWGVNIAGDMKNLRFGGEDPQSAWQKFLKDLACVLEANLDAHPNLKVVLFPHIPSDLGAITELLDELGDFYTRSRIVVAPLWQGWAGCEALFGLYQQCQLAISMRFHANITPLVVGVPTIGLASYPKIEALYREMGARRAPVSVRSPDFMDNLQAEIDRRLGPDSSPADLDPDTVEKVRAAVEPFEMFLRQKVLNP